MKKENISVEPIHLVGTPVHLYADDKSIDPEATKRTSRPLIRQHRRRFHTRNLAQYPENIVSKLMKKENSRTYIGSALPTKEPQHLSAGVKSISIKPTRRRTRSVLGLSRRHPHSNGIYMGVCESASSWNSLSVAKNVNDEVVQVASFIEVGDRIINQYFYETKCVNKHRPCEAVDKTKYHSKCTEKYSYVYAIVIKNGVSILDFIKITTSCNCANHRYRNKERFHRMVLAPGE